MLLSVVPMRCGGWMVRVSGVLLCAIRDDRGLSSRAKLLALFLVVFRGMSSTQLAEVYRSRRSFFRDLAELRAAGWVAADGFEVTHAPGGRRPPFRRAAVTVLLLDERISQKARLVATMIRLRGDRYVAQFRETLEGDTGYGSRTVEAALAELRRSGWLVPSETDGEWTMKLINLRQLRSARVA